MAPVPKVLMISYCQGKGTEDFSRPADLGKLHRDCDFSRPIIVKSHTCAWQLILILMN